MSLHGTDDWRGAVVLVLAVTVGLVIVIVALGVVFAEVKLGSDVAKSFAGIIGAIIGGLLTYIGGRSRNGGGNGERG